MTKEGSIDVFFETVMTRNKKSTFSENKMGRAKRIWCLLPMRAAKGQASLRIRAVSPETPLLAHTSIESRGTFRQKTRSLAPLNGWACAVKSCHDGMLEDTNSLDAAQMVLEVALFCDGCYFCQKCQMSTVTYITTI